ncbi:hypothetical protein F2Q69_00023833 [Brassica cretica]|uniref:Uncharacterized protein n=1 Tax=Brassica cretica TaxID=69181 RepID=A0A8S9QQU0_BRACR|nr:hypothetical protein F2Q69_00023833 [Brassica cretica]
MINRETTVYLVETNPPTKSSQRSPGLARRFRTAIAHVAAPDFDAIRSFFTNLPMSISD